MPAVRTWVVTSGAGIDCHAAGGFRGAGAVVTPYQIGGLIWGFLVGFSGISGAFPWLSAGFGLFPQGLAE